MSNHFMFFCHFSVFVYVILMFSSSTCYALHLLFIQALSFYAGVVCTLKVNIRRSHMVICSLIMAFSHLVATKSISVRTDCVSDILVSTS